MAAKKKVAKRKTSRKPKKAASKLTPEKLAEIEAAIQNGLTVDDVFEISILEDDSTGALMNIGFTELGHIAIEALKKRNPKITEKDIEDYVHKISSRLIVLVAEKIKEEEQKTKDERAT